MTSVPVPATAERVNIGRFAIDRTEVTIDIGFRCAYDLK